MDPTAAGEAYYLNLRKNENNLFYWHLIKLVMGGSNSG